MDQKCHIIDQKGLKIEVLDLKYLLFSGIFLAELGNTPPQRKKIRLVVFCSFPITQLKKIIVAILPMFIAHLIF